MVDPIDFIIIYYSNQVFSNFLFLEVLKCKDLDKELHNIMTYYWLNLIS